MANKPIAHLWGMPVYTSCYIPRGKMLLLPSTWCFPRAVGLNTDDFNAMKIVAEPEMVDSEHSTYETWVTAVDALLRDVQAQES